MGVRFGEIDSDQILQNEFRIGVLEQIVEFFLNNNRKPTLAEVDEFRKRVIADLQKKYPNSGIALKQ